MSKLCQNITKTVKKTAIVGSTDISRSADVLKLLSINITPEDRELAEAELKVSKTTQSRYLNGKVKKIHVAISLIRFYKSQIRKRKQIISA